MERTRTDSFSEFGCEESRKTCCGKRWMWDLPFVLKMGDFGICFYANGTDWGGFSESSEPSIPSSHPLFPHHPDIK